MFGAIWGPQKIEFMFRTVFFNFFRGPWAPYWGPGPPKIEFYRISQKIKNYTKSLFYKKGPAKTPPVFETNR